MSRLDVEVECATCRYIGEAWRRRADQLEARRFHDDLGQLAPGYIVGRPERAVRVPAHNVMSISGLDVARERVAGRYVGEALAVPRHQRQVEGQHHHLGYLGPG